MDYIYFESYNKQNKVEQILFYHSMKNNNSLHTNLIKYIIGCDRGIGHVLAKQLDRKGFYVFAGCLKNRGQGSKDLVDGSSSRLQTLQLDVSKLTQVKSALHTVEQQLHSKGNI